MLGSIAQMRLDVVKRFDSQRNVAYVVAVQGGGDEGYRGGFDDFFARYLGGGDQRRVQLIGLTKLDEAF